MHHIYFFILTVYYSHSYLSRYFCLNLKEFQSCTSLSYVSITLEFLEDDNKSIETCSSDNINTVKIKKNYIYIYYALLVEIKTIYKMYGTYIKIRFRYWSLMAVEHRNI